MFRGGIGLYSDVQKRVGPNHVTYPIMYFMLPTLTPVDRMTDGGDNKLCGFWHSCSSFEYHVILMSHISTIIIFKDDNFVQRILLNFE